MTDWTPKPGDTVMVVNPNNYELEYGHDVIGKNVEFKAMIMSGHVRVAVVECPVNRYCYCFRMDMIAQPVDPRRAVLEELFCFGRANKDAWPVECTESSNYANERIDIALRKLDNLPPF